MKTTLLAAALLTYAAPVIAQDSPAPATPGHTVIVTSNPLMLAAGGPNVEVERKLSESMTMGVTAGSITLLFEERFSTAAVTARYYPRGRTLNGPYVGVKAGLHRFSGEGDWLSSNSVSHTRPGVGLDVGATWQFGKTRGMVAGLGAGVMRLLGPSLEYRTMFVGNIRLNVGVAF
jgi:hypothetical protein